MLYLILAVTGVVCCLYGIINSCRSPYVIIAKKPDEEKA